MVSAPKFKVGTPEHRAYMRQIAFKGGYATRDKHPGHLQAIASLGGKAVAGQPRPGKGTKKKKRDAVEPPAPAPAKAFDLDEFFDQLGGV